MRKLFLITMVLCALASISNAQSFETSNIRAGAGFFYVSDINSIAISANGTYRFTPEWEGSISLSHAFEKDNLSYQIADADVHFSFYTFNNNISVYGLGGLGITFSRYRVKGYNYTNGNAFTYNTTDNELGVNLGVGANIPLMGYLNLAPEFKFTTSYGSYIRVGATLQYCF